MTSERPRRSRPWLSAALGWIPVIVLVPVLLIAGLLAFVFDEGADAGAQRSHVRTDTPIVSARRVAAGLANGQTDRALRAELDAFMAQQPPNSCLTVALPNFRYDHRGAEPQIPASLMKILTGYTALELIGSETTLETVVLADAAVADGVIAGNLYLRGGGDPLLLSEDRFAQVADDPGPHTNIGALADRIVEAGVTTVTGAIIGDDSRYDQERFHPEWPRRYVSQGQSGPIAALTVDGGAAVARGGNEPAANAAEALRHALAARGVLVAGGSTTGVVPADATSLATLASAPMRDLVAHILATSNNTTAEALLKEVGLAAAEHGSFAAGAGALAARAATLGAVDGTHIVDGSGLSTGNVVTCGLVAAVLFDSDHAATLADGLAVAGETGTMRQRWRDHPLAGLVRGKTGSLSTVRALAGYVDPPGATADDEESVQFVYIVNVDEPSAMTDSVVASPMTLVEILARYPSVADISGLLPGHR